MQLKHKQAGDTLIEVLMAMTVLAVVIGSAYTIANRSMRINRQTQDRSQATKVMESQFERIKYASRQSGSSDDTAKKAYATYADFVTGANHTGCFSEDLGKVSSCTVDNKYTVTTTYYPDAGDDGIAANVFKVSVVWDEDGTGDKSVEGYYRVYDSSSGGSGDDTVIVTTPPPAIPTPTCTMVGGNKTTTADGYTVHTFLSSGSLVATSCTNIAVEYLIVGGGGAGGAGNYNEGGGGGGAGGYIAGTYVVNTGPYTVTVGSGGPSVSDTHASPSNGGNSSVFSVIAYGGGGGASCWKDAGFSTPGSGGNGGSGGGGSGCNANGAGGTSTMPAPPVGYGTNGGSGQWTGGGSGSCNGNGGGGGGAGGAGQSGSLRNTTCTGGAGSIGGAGVGKTSTITGNSITYALGGNGAAGRSRASGAAGADNTGNGGSGSSGNDQGTVYASGKGGSGIVIIRYKL